MIDECLNNPCHHCPYFNSECKHCHTIAHHPPKEGAKSRLNKNSPCTRIDDHSCSNTGCSCRGARNMEDCCNAFVMQPVKKGAYCSCEKPWHDSGMQKGQEDPTTCHYCGLPLRPTQEPESWQSRLEARFSPDNPVFNIGPILYGEIKSFIQKIQAETASRSRQEVLSAIEAERKEPTLCGECNLNGDLCRRCSANRQVNAVIDRLLTHLSSSESSSKPNQP